MSNKPEPLNVDDLFGPAESEVAKGGANSTQWAPLTPSLPPQPTKPFLEKVIVYLAVALFAYLLVSKLIDRDSQPDDDDRVVDVRVEKPTVLIAWDPNGTTSDGQSDVLNTTKIQTWCEDNGVEYRRFDVASDLSAVEPYWLAMMDAATDPPSLNIALPNGTAKTMVLPDTVETTIKKIEKEVN